MKLSSNIDKELVERIIDSVILDQAWNDAKKLYGKNAVNSLKELFPADPDFLYDMAAFSYKTDGKTEEEIKEILDNYSYDDWDYDMKHFAKTVKKVKKLASSEIYRD